MGTPKGEVIDIVTACQALALRGCGSGIGDHVSIREPGIREDRRGPLKKPIDEQAGYLEQTWP